MTQPIPWHHRNLVWFEDFVPEPLDPEDYPERISPEDLCRLGGPEPLPPSLPGSTPRHIKFRNHVGEWQ